MPVWEDLTPSQRTAWYGFLRAHADIARELDAELESAHGLPLSSYDVLVTLRGAPGGEMRMSELADAVVLSRSGLTRLVDRLERCGWVVRRRGSETDARAITACLTQAGRRKLRDAAPTHVSGIQRLFLDRLDDADAEQLARIWRKLLGERLPER